MAEEEKQGEKKVEEKKALITDEGEKIIRVYQSDIPGNKNVYAGLTRIKGVSWAISNSVCRLTGIDKKKKVTDLGQDEIKKIEETLKKAEFPIFLVNRRKDLSTGENKHLLVTDLELAKEFDVKRLKKIRSYRGLRHALGLPTRGQKTRSNFRKNRKKGVGIKFKKRVTRENA